MAAAATVCTEASAEEEMGSGSSTAGSRLQSAGALLGASEGLPQPEARDEPGKDVEGSGRPAQLAVEDSVMDAAIAVDDMRVAMAPAPQGSGQAVADPRAAQGLQAAAVCTSAVAPVQAPGESSVAPAEPVLADAVSPASRKRHRPLEPADDTSERRWQAARPEAPVGHSQSVHSVVSVATAVIVDADMDEACAEAAVGYHQGIHSVVSVATAVTADADMDAAAAPADGSMAGEAEAGAAAPASPARLGAPQERHLLALQGAAAGGGMPEHASGQAAAQPAAPPAATPPCMDAPHSAHSTAPAQAAAPRSAAVQQLSSPLQPSGALSFSPHPSSGLHHAHPPAVGPGLRASEDRDSVQQPRDLQLSAECLAAEAGAPAPMEVDSGGSEDSFRSAYDLLARDGSLASTAATEWQDALSSMEAATPPATPGRRSAPSAAPAAMHPGKHTILRITCLCLPDCVSLTVS